MSDDRYDITPCAKCGSTEGRFHDFDSHYHRSTMYYWMCECGRNHGHSYTKQGAIDEWNNFNKAEAQS